jgi:hypothetical protein
MDTPPSQRPAELDVRACVDFVVDELANDERVLDVGAGAPLAQALADRDTGLQVSAFNVALGTATVGMRDLLTLPQRLDQSFDAVVVHQLLCHPGPELIDDVVDLLAGRLSAGGVLLVDDVDHAAVDKRAATWVVDRLTERGEDPPGPIEWLDAHEQRHEAMCRWPVIVAALSRWFRPRWVCTTPALARRHLDGDAEARQAEIAALQARQLPSVGRRLVAERRRVPLGRRLRDRMVRPALRRPRRREPRQA